MNPIRQLLLLIFLAGVLLPACTPLPKLTDRPVRKIAVPPGPEDIVLDDFGERPRLLISCSDHRKTERPPGEIVSFDPGTGRAVAMARLEEPANQPFHPHGIHLQQVDDKLYLYVVLHDDPNQSHYVALYQVVGDQLYWVRNYSSPLFRSPNGVCALPDGSFYVSNDHYKRGSNWETLLKKKKSQVVYVSPDGEAHLAADRVAYGNGILHRNGRVYQAATRGNKIWAYTVDGTRLTDREKAAKCKGPDNLRWQGGQLLVACHLRIPAFIRHFKNPEKRSPTVVYRVDPATGEKTVVFSDDGTRISAGSTAIVFGGKLYIAQVFDPFILEVDLEESKEE